MQTAARHYLLLVGIAVAVLVLILRAGSHLPAPEVPLPISGTSLTSESEKPVAAAPFNQAVEERLVQNAEDPLSRFFLQLFVVITVSYSVGWLFTRCGQPAVVGEMMAGVLLGPSLFGWLAPHAFQFVFAASSLEPLRLLSQVGVCLFMFAVGMEMDWTELRQKAAAAILVSHASIAIPCLLGAGLAYLLFDQLAEPGAPFVGFALFVAISMSITAFPVLVRILQDRGILKSSLGRMASASAAVGDVTAWALLAFVVAIAKSADFASALFCLGLVLVFVAIMFLVVKPNLPAGSARRLWKQPDAGEEHPALMLSLLFSPPRSALSYLESGPFSVLSSPVSSSQPAEVFAASLACASRTSVPSCSFPSSLPSRVCAPKSGCSTRASIG